MGLLLGGAGLAFATPLAAVILVLVNMLYIQDYLKEPGICRAGAGAGEKGRRRRKKNASDAASSLLTFTLFTVNFPHSDFGPWNWNAAVPLPPLTTMVCSSGCGEARMPGVDLVGAVEQMRAELERGRAVRAGDGEAAVGERAHPGLHPRVDVALERVDAGIVELLLVGLALVGLAELKMVSPGGSVGPGVDAGEDVVERGVGVEDLERRAGDDGEDVRDVAAADLPDFGLGRGRACWARTWDRRSRPRRRRVRPWGRSSSFRCGGRGFRRSCWRRR